MPTTFKKLSALHHTNGDRSGDIRQPTWSALKSQNLDLFEKIESMLDAAQAQDVDTYAAGLAALLFSAYDTAYTMGMDADVALDQLIKNKLVSMPAHAMNDDRSMPPVIATDTILLVEDDPDEEQFARYAFGQAGWGGHIVVARDGQEALDYLLGAGAHKNRNACEVPRVVFLDINLPRVNGFEVLQALRDNAATQFVPVVMLTNSDRHIDRLEGYRRGANSYVRKALDLDAFVDSVRALSHYWLDLNRAVYG